MLYHFFGVLEIIEKYIALPTKSISKIGNISTEDTTREIKKLLESKKISKLTKNTLDQEKYYITTEHEKILTNKIIRFLKDFHLINPLQKGASKEHISSLTNINPEIFSILINNLIESGELVQKHSLIKLKSHSPRLSESQNFEVNKYIKILESNSYAPPTNHTIEKDIINFLIWEIENVVSRNHLHDYGLVRVWLVEHSKSIPSHYRIDTLQVIHSAFTPKKTVWCTFHE